MTTRRGRPGRSPRTRRQSTTGPSESTHPAARRPRRGRSRTSGSGSSDGATRASSTPGTTAGAALARVTAAARVVMVALTSAQITRRSPLRALDRVAEEHGDGGGPDPAHPGRDPARHLLAALVDVGQQLLALVAHAAADHDDARREVLGLEDAGHAGGRDHDVGPLGVLRPVGHAGVHDGDRGVRRRPLLRQQQRERAAEGGAAPEDAHVAPGDRDLVVREERLDPRGRARHRPGHRQREPARG